ncbi:MAG TPA: threonine/serine exporter family protein [Rikenella microfusus]|uniref:Inner membrane protein YjjP n=2 Tax=Rikenella microfusus TaxID=28139 RepID=A0A379MV47_9BACT|nr:threonine/serine exporter family protein [Rikenella microfusus]SUE34512.1 Inner membrane protein YjjP [Rikenella microfusus]HJE89072.1 threonine/serine exporter family protein [Rikenella microfusus]
MAMEITQQDSEKLLHRKLDLLLRTGKLLMESAADTSRIMRNMKRTAAYLGLPEEHLHIYINYNMLMVNLGDEEHSFSKFQRCEKHGINMTAISAISKLSWRAIREDYSLERYEEELENIRTRKRNYTPWQVAVGAGFACGGFCIQFGCDWPAFFYASIAAILGFRVRAVLNDLGSNHYVNIAAAAFVATLLAWASAFLSTAQWPGALGAVLHSDTPWHPLLACALFIVPGVPLINFVSDMLDNYVQVGITRAVNTLLIVVAMAFGIALAIRVCGIDNFVKDLSITPHHTYLEFAVAAAISAMGFSMIFNIPRRLLWVVAIGGIIAVCTRNFVNLGPSNNNIGLDWGPVIGSLVGSALISIIVTRLVHQFRTPHHCLSIPSVIPMIPGVLMYRALFAFIDMRGVVGEVTVAMNNAIQASLMILCIAIGVAIPNIFARRWITPKRRKQLKQMIEERRLRGKFVDLTNIG